MTVAVLSISVGFAACYLLVSRLTRASGPELHLFLESRKEPVKKRAGIVDANSFAFWDPKWQHEIELKKFTSHENEKTCLTFRNIFVLESFSVVHENLNANFEGKNRRKEDLKLS